MNGSALIIAALAAALFAACASARDDLAKPVSGRDIYFGRTGGISCASCHGVAGRGGGEGGIAIPSLLATQTGSPRYPDAAALCRTLRTGLSPNGATLSDYMPRVAHSPQECRALFAFIVSLTGRELPGVSDTEVRLAVAVDEASPGQAAWRDRVGSLVETVNRSGGVHGRALRLTAADDTDDVLFSLLFAPTAVKQRNTLFEIGMRGAAAPPFVRSIETPARDEALALLALYPHRTVAFFGGTDTGTQEELRERANDIGASLVAFGSCGSPGADVAILFDIPATGPSAGLPVCPTATSYAVSLRRISLPALSDFDARTPRRETALAIPLPVGPAFSRTPDKLMQIVISTLRSMGRHPTLSDTINAFDSSWSKTAGSPESLYFGISVWKLGDDNTVHWVAAG